MINTYTTQRYLSETPYSNCGNKKLEDFYSKIYYLSLGLSDIYSILESLVNDMIS